LTPAQAAACFAICQANQIIAAGPDKRVQYRPGSAELEAHVSPRRNGAKQTIVVR
jgi:hypothetical protein